MKVIKYSILSCVILLAITHISCGVFRVNHKEFAEKTEGILYTKAVSVSVDSTHKIRVVLTKKDSTQKPTLVFVHGTPGGGHNFLEFHKDSLLVEKYNILSYDRPGFGYKDKYPSLTSLKEQAKVLHQVLDSLGLSNAVLYAHSFGGAIAIQAAIDYPEQIDKLVLVAVAVDPENEKYFWFGKLGKWKATKWMLPKVLRVSGNEKYTHEDELRKLKPQLDKVTQKVWIVHGDADGMVPFENVAFLQKELKNAEIETTVVKDGNHFLPFGVFSLFSDGLLFF